MKIIEKEWSFMVRVFDSFLLLAIFLIYKDNMNAIVLDNLTTYTRMQLYIILIRDSLLKKDLLIFSNGKSKRLISFCGKYCRWQCLTDARTQRLLKLSFEPLTFYYHTIRMQKQFSNCILLIEMQEGFYLFFFLFIYFVNYIWYCVVHVFI